ncbi:MAG TPA: heme lyase CcmF/NrfE family subunit [Ktedonobacteraceae bacterium]
MYFSDLGSIALILALGFAVYTMIAAVLGAVYNLPRLVISAKRSTLVVTFFMLLAAAALVISFLIHDFSVVYVADQSNRSMPWYFVAAAFYSGQEGSLLYWGLMLSVFSALFLLTSRRVPAALMPYILATLMGIETFFTLMLATVSSPFVRFPHAAPADGAGLNPLLRDPGMLVHPPTLLMGFMSFSLPFAFAVAAMITGRLDSEWLRAIRRWTLAAWTIQTAGLLLGMWWSYHVLGWGGYWEWDPVENAALFPWLTATAFLHSTMVQERRGMLKVWNLGLVIASFALSIFGTFEVRSGLISSVHSFAYSPIGGYFLGFLCIVIVFSLGLFIFRLPKLRPEQEFDSVISREGSFLLNNFLLVGITAATLWGTLFPLISQSFGHLSQTVGSTFYNEVDGPIFVALLFMMGVGPLLAWRRATTSTLWRNLLPPVITAAACALILPLAGIRDIIANLGFTVCAFTAGSILYELWRGMRVRHSHGEPYPLALILLIQRYRRRYGGYIVHLGLILLAAGVIGSHVFQQEHDTSLKPGQTVTIGDYKLVYFGNTDTTYPDVEIVAAQIQIWRGGQLQAYIYPARQFYANFANEPASQISITTQNFSDLYVFLADWKGAGQASFRIFINPLVPLIWSGGVMMLFGGIICWWPERRRRRGGQIIPADSRETSSTSQIAASPRAEPVASTSTSTRADQEASV